MMQEWVMGRIKVNLTLDAEVAEAAGRIASFTA